MAVQGLLNRSLSCRCGKTHTLPIHAFIYQKSLYEQLPSLLAESGIHPGRGSILIAADKRTLKVCGEKVPESLSGFSRHSFFVVPDRSQGEGPVCDESTMGLLKQQVRRAAPDFLLAVGSGVINDLCKWVSFELDLPYGVIATAASMNGYSAANVAPMIDGVKVLVRARPPVFVGADPEVIEKAPFEMTASGFGDTLAKFMSHADWRMNHFLFDEYYCEFCAGMADDLEGLFIERPDKIAKKDPEAIRGLFETLFRSGAAMTLAGTSAPASGGEHLLSHTLDMISHVRCGRHDLHGRQVGLGTIFSAALYERILSIEKPDFVRPAGEIDWDFWKEPGLISAAGKEFELKKPFLERACERLSDPAEWKGLQDSLAGLVKPAGQIKDWLRRAGAAHTVEGIGLGREAILEAVSHMHEIRKRFTVVDLARLTGVLPDCAEEIVDQWLLE